MDAHEIWVAPLTTMEERVLRAAALGWDIQQTAGHLGLAPQTIKFHRGWITRKFRKVGRTTIHEVIAACFRTGYLDPFDVRQP